MASTSNNTDGKVVKKLLKVTFEGETSDVIQILKDDDPYPLIQSKDSKGNTALYKATKDGQKETIFEVVHLFAVVKNHDLLCDLQNRQNDDKDTPLYFALLKGNYNNEAAHKLVHVDHEAADVVENENQSTHNVVSNGVGGIGSVRSSESSEYSEPQNHTVEFLDMPLDVSDIIGHEQEDDEEEDEDDEDDSDDSDDDDEDEDDDDEENLAQLHTAICEGNIDKVMRILAQDQDLINEEDENGWNAVHIAADRDQLRVLKKIEELMDNTTAFKKLLLEETDDGDTALHLALYGGYERMARYLIQVQPCAAYSLNDNDKSPLHLAVKAEYSSLIRSMTRNGLSNRIKSKLLHHAKEKFLAHKAIMTKNLDVLKAIMEGLPALIESQDEEGFSPLSYAIYKGYREHVHYLCNKFPCVKKRDGDGSWPIHKAIKGGDRTIVKELVSNCPRAMKDLDSKGRNLMDCAEVYGRQDIISYLRWHKLI